MQLIEWMSKHMQLLQFHKLEEAYPIDHKIQYKNQLFTNLDMNKSNVPYEHRFPVFYLSFMNIG
jgi:hypothetical protein